MNKVIKNTVKVALTAAALEVYADDNGKPCVKPFVLVVCKDTAHAR